MPPQLSQDDPHHTDGGLASPGSSPAYNPPLPSEIPAEDQSQSTKDFSSASLANLTPWPYLALTVLAVILTVVLGYAVYNCFRSIRLSRYAVEVKGSDGKEPDERKSQVQETPGKKEKPHQVSSGEKGSRRSWFSRSKPPSNNTKTRLNPIKQHAQIHDSLLLSPIYKPRSPDGSPPSSTFSGASSTLCASYAGSSIDAHSFSPIPGSHPPPFSAFVDAAAFVHSSPVITPTSFATPDPFVTASSFRSHTPDVLPSPLPPLILFSPSTDPRVASTLYAPPTPLTLQPSSPTATPAREDTAGTFTKRTGALAADERKQTATRTESHTSFLDFSSDDESEGPDERPSEDRNEEPDGEYTLAWDGNLVAPTSSRGGRDAKRGQDPKQSRNINTKSKGGPGCTVNSSHDDGGEEGQDAKRLTKTSNQPTTQAPSASTQDPPHEQPHHRAFPLTLRPLSLFKSRSPKDGETSPSSLFPLPPRSPAGLHTARLSPLPFSSHSSSPISPTSILHTPSSPAPVLNTPPPPPASIQHTPPPESILRTPSPSPSTYPRSASAPVRIQGPEKPGVVWVREGGGERQAGGDGGRLGAGAGAGAGAGGAGVSESGNAGSGPGLTRSPPTITLALAASPAAIRTGPGKGAESAVRSWFA